jgi:glycoside/pentoside/hexuronide:cation symporter, GPH family
MTDKKIRTCSTVEMASYSTGDIATSLVINTFSGFAMLFYTKALGLNPVWAGAIMSVSVFWDSISDPIMGHISDNTRSRYGRRHPYILIGGLFMVATFLFFWIIPASIQSNKVILISYLVILNLALRTTFTVFIVPFTALGFEICQDYTGRTKLQGIRTITNMLANLGGPAMAWVLFFKEVEGAPRAISLTSNYIRMSMIFAFVSFIAILYVVFYTKKTILDSRTMKLEGGRVKDFFIDMKEIITDHYSIWVFVFTFIGGFGLVITAVFQMFLYEDFMKLSPFHKTLTHGGTMVGMMLGASFASLFVKHLDKKRTVYIGTIFSVACGVILSVLFLTGLLKPGQTLAVFVFAILNSLYWFGNGVMSPVIGSMMADISEINEIKTGINKDGAYSAMLTFASKLSQAAAMFVTGLCFVAIGIVEGKDVVQSPEVLSRLFMLTFIIGPLISLSALIIIKFYPVNKAFLLKMRGEIASDTATEQGC